MHIEAPGDGHSAAGAVGVAGDILFQLSLRHAAEEHPEIPDRAGDEEVRAPTFSDRLRL